MRRNYFKPTRFIIALLLLLGGGVLTVHVHSQTATPTSNPCAPVNKEIIVGPTGTTGVCTDLQKAIDAVTEDRTYIKLKKGNYTFNSYKTNAIEIINKPIIFIENAENTEERGVNISISNASYGFYIEKSSVLLSGLDITSNTNASAIKMKNVSNAELNSLTVSSSRVDGITVDTSSNVYIFKSLIKSNGNAIRLINATNTVLANNTITSSNYGIQMNNTSGFIEHNLFTGNKVSSVYMLSNNSITLNSNTITNNNGSSVGAISQVGYSATRSSITLNKNIISKNAGTFSFNAVGVYIATPNQVDLKITNNDVWENGTNYRGVTDPTGKDGNISIDPKYANSVNFCLDPSSPLITDQNSTKDYIGYRSTCDQLMPPLPTIAASVTPIITLPPAATPTTIPVPTEPETCTCKSDDSCDTSCTYFATPSAALRCSRESAIGPTPDSATKTNYCKRYLRTSGDVDGNNRIDTVDYFYYLRVVNGGQVPADINADVNGDGLVSPSDRAIIVQNINNPPVPSPTGDFVPTPTSVAPTAITVTPRPTSTSIPTPTQRPSATPWLSPTLRPSITPVFGVRYGCSNNCASPISTGWFTSQSYCQIICKNLNLNNSSPTPSN